MFETSVHMRKWDRSHKWCHRIEETSWSLSRTFSAHHLAPLSIFNVFSTNYYASAHALLLFDDFFEIFYHILLPLNTQRFSFSLFVVFFSHQFFLISWMCGHGRECRSLNFTVRHLSTYIYAITSKNFEFCLFWWRAARSTCSRWLDHFGSTKCDGKSLREKCFSESKTHLPIQYWAFFNSLVTSTPLRTQRTKNCLRLHSNAIHYSLTYWLYL